ncbi:MAG TPA: hypothetical protein VHU92_06480 [Streptosporangiaceae bacterium]|nr:hypothetical protein [Streptosporangiaceae bacterium]
MHSRAKGAPRPAGRPLALASAAIIGLAWLLLPASWASAQPAGRPSGKPTATHAPQPAPTLSIASTSPVLTQTGPGTWITTILVADSGAAVRRVTYKLIPLAPSHRVVTGTIIACSPGTARHCPLALDQVTRVRIRFRSRFPVPLAQAALVIDGHHAAGRASTAAPALVPQQIQLTVQRQVGPWYDLGVPLAVAAALAALTIILILILARRLRPVPDRIAPRAPAPRRPTMANGDPTMASLATPATAAREHAVEIYAPERDGLDLGLELGVGRAEDEWTIRGQRADPEPDRQSFLRRPVYASASWSFKDSWATHITALGGAAGAIAVAAGASSTVFPGVALDRFAILLALFAAVVVAAPLVLGLSLPRSDDPDRVKATGFSLLLAAFVTLVGVGGEIGTIACLIWLSSPAHDTRLALLLLPATAFVIVTWYACRTTLELAAHNHPGASHSSALSSGRDSSITL